MVLLWVPRVATKPACDGVRVLECLTFRDSICLDSFDSKSKIKFPLNPVWRHAGEALRFKYLGGKDLLSVLED